MNTYRESRETFRMPCHHALGLDSPAIATNHWGYRKLIVQLERVARMMFYEKAFTAPLWSAKLVAPEQMIAEVLVKVLPSRYARKTLEAGTRIFGHDERFPQHSGSPRC